MKISRNWLNNYLVSNKTDEQLVDLFTQLGLECSFDKIEFDFTNIVIGKVEACSKHPETRYPKNQPNRLAYICLY